MSVMYISIYFPMDFRKNRKTIGIWGTHVFDKVMSETTNCLIHRLVRCDEPGSRFSDVGTKLAKFWAKRNNLTVIDNNSNDYKQQ